MPIHKIRIVKYVINNEQRKRIMHKAEIIEKFNKGEILAYKDFTEELRKDPDVYKAAIKLNKLAYKYALGDILKDKEMIKLAIKATHYNYKTVPEELKSDKNLNLELVMINPSIFKLMKEESQKDEDIFSLVLARLGEDDSIMYVKKYFKDSENILMKVIENKLRYGIHVFSDKLKNDKKILEKILPMRREEICYFSKEVRDRKDVFDMCIENNYENIVYFDYKKENIPVYKKACEINMRLFSFLPEEIRDNKEFVMSLLKNTNESMHMNDEINNTIILSGIKDKLKNDREFFLEIASFKWSSNFSHLLPKKFWEDKDILKAYVLTNLRSTRFIDKSFSIELHQYQDIAEILLENDNLKYEELSDEIKNSFQFNEKALSLNASFFKFMNNKMKSHPAFVKKYGAVSKENFKHVPVETKRDIQLMIESLNANVHLFVDLFQLLPEDTKLDKILLNEFRILLRKFKNIFHSENMQLEKYDREDYLNEKMKESDRVITKRKKI